MPCASTRSMSGPDSPAPASAALMARCCAGPLGAVRPLLAPSWFTAVPRTSASTGWPRRRASDSRSTSSTPTPSPQPVPFAAWAKDRQRPSGDSPCWRLNSTKTSGLAITAAPPTSANEQSPVRSACPARCSATREEEQAVSTVTAGPSRPRMYEIRPDATLVTVPLSRCPSTSAAASRGPVPYPWEATPT